MKEDMSLMLLKNIHHRFELRCITENYLEQLKNVNRFYCLYLFFNRELLDGLICVEDVESDSSESCISGSLDEHDYLQLRNSTR